MKFSYAKLWKMLIDRDMKKKDLAAQARITANTMSNMGKGQAVSLETIGRICRLFDCDIGDVVEIVIEEED